AHLGVCLTHVIVCLAHLIVCLAHLRVCLAHVGVCLAHLGARAWTERRIGRRERCTFATPRLTAGGAEGGSGSSVSGAEEVVRLAREKALGLRFRG
ncbi:hypothetical protein T484DRAFT_1614951, partial [Baffinella frigidus]